MKILAIRGKNMASLEGEFAVEFREEPLSSAGIFAITGRTGSGKTTLLDTMCTALFNNSPRMNKINDSADLADVKEATIKEKDSRNILRRGTAEGYAEVDFRALDGNEYRARWSVRRSRNKIDGKLQDWFYSLFCITDGNEISGTKSELLEKVRSLIGLTYEQFTRAVLLAQGDFATFLKASSREKAELLEKLTGTDIYSRISQKIYEKYKDADSNLRNIEQRIKEIAILSDESYAELVEEKKRITEEIKKFEDETKILQSKLEWLERFKQLCDEERKAEEELVSNKKKMAESDYIIKELEQIENIRPIRDTYMEIIAIKKQKKEFEQQLESYIAAEQQQNEIFAIAEKELAKELDIQKQLNEDWNVIQPKIREALRIEEGLKNMKLQHAECQKELDDIKKSYQHEEKKLHDTIENIKNERSERTDIAEWFDKHSRYKKAIAQNNIICSEVAEAEKSLAQVATMNKMLISAQEIQKTQKQQLDEAQHEAERLKAALTSEIAALREKLVEGEPCPVCGSREHKVATITGEILQEKLLIEARKSNEATIAHLTKCIENRNSEIIELTSSIATYNKFGKEKITHISDLLSDIIEYKNVDEDINKLSTIKTTAENIKKIAMQWEEKEKRYIFLEKQLSSNETALEILQTKIKDIQTNLNEKRTRNSEIEQNIKSNLDKIRCLLGNGTTAEAVEKQFATQIDKMNNNVVAHTERRNKIIVTLEKCRQQISSVKESIIKSNKDFESCKKKILEFLSSMAAPITLEQLHYLATKDTEKVANMQKHIMELKESVLMAETRLQERKQNTAKHHKATIRPEVEETKESIAAKLQYANKEVATYMERLTQIGVALKNDEGNRIHAKELNREYTSQRSITERWEKLNSLLGSADGKKFRVIAQGYTLDIMLAYANIHLKSLSNRYELARISPDSLALKVIDMDMLSESRSVHSLSGGESFLVSLALALGLSSLSSNRMSIESLFIDEGFGSLDSETLQTAMDALDKLQSQGRKIGVISHLTDMIERIPTRIHITKETSGKSRISIRK